MPKKKKVEAVAKLEDDLRRSQVAVFVDYRGLSAPEMTKLRRQLKEKGVEFRVVKNTLTRLALERLKRGNGAGLLDGPTTIAFGYADERIPPQALTEYIKTTKSPLRIKGGFLKERMLSPSEVGLLATLPAKEELIAKVLGGMESPLISLVYVLSSQIRALSSLLKVRSQQLEGGGHVTS